MPKSYSCACRPARGDVPESVSAAEWLFFFSFFFLSFFFLGSSMDSYDPCCQQEMRRLLDLISDFGLTCRLNPTV